MATEATRMPIRAARFIAHLAEEKPEPQYNTASNGTQKESTGKPGLAGAPRGGYRCTKTHISTQMLPNYHTRAAKRPSDGYKLLILRNKQRNYWMTICYNP